MPARPVSRSDLRRALVVNALTAPVNVLVPTGVLIGGVLIGAWWLAVVAIACWLALAFHTFFDERVAGRVGARVHATSRGALPAAGVSALAPAIDARVRAAIAARAAIQEAIAAARFPLADVAGEVDALVAAMETDALRAQRIHEFLAAQESAASLERRIAQEPYEPVRAALAAKHRALARVREQFSRLLAEMDQVVATLQTVQAEALVADDLEQRAIASRVAELRANVELVAAGLEEAFADTRSAALTNRGVEGPT